MHLVLIVSIFLFSFASAQEMENEITLPDPFEDAPIVLQEKIVEVQDENIGFSNALVNKKEEKADKSRPKKSMTAVRDPEQEDEIKIDLAGSMIDKSNVETEIEEDEKSEDGSILLLFGSIAAVGFVGVGFFATMIAMLIFFFITNRR